MKVSSSVKIDEDLLENVFLSIESGLENSARGREMVKDMASAIHTKTACCPWTQRLIWNEVKA